MTPHPSAKAVELVKQNMRPEFFKEFLEAWAESHVIICEDFPQATQQEVDARFFLCATFWGMLSFDNTDMEPVANA